MDKRTHCLLYNPSVSIDDIVPFRSLAETLHVANTRPTKHLTTDFDLMANLVRLNWMVENLKHEPVYKPILVDQNMQILVGDTRMMAIKLAGHITHVSCIMTTSIEDIDSDWIYVHDNEHLGSLLDIDPRNIILNEDWHYNAIDWIEFAYDHTANHMHDADERARMIANYLEENPDTVFTEEWLQTPIDWSNYAVNR